MGLGNRGKQRIQGNLTSGLDALLLSMSAKK